MANRQYRISKSKSVFISRDGGCAYLTRMDFGSPREYFMQNKANFKKAQINVKYYLQKDYENESRRRLWENKAKQSQFLDDGNKNLKGDN